MKQRIVIKLKMDCEKCRNKALKTAADVKGVTTVSLEGDDKDRVAVTGDNVDMVCLVNRLQKKFRCVIILTVEEVKKKEPKKDEKKDPKSCAIVCLPPCEPCSKCHSTKCGGQCSPCKPRPPPCSGQCPPWYRCSWCSVRVPYKSCDPYPTRCRVIYDPCPEQSGCSLM